MLYFILFVYSIVLQDDTQLAIAPLVAAGLISAGGKLIGGLANMFGGNSKMAREQAFQREMWQNQVAQQDKVNAQQMAYQDKVNAENREWSRESNVRERLEEAGYNPYLYNGQAGSSGSAGMATGTNLGDSVSAPSGFPVDNPLAGLGDAASSIGDVMAQSMAIGKAKYDFNRQQSIDQLNDAAQGGKIGATESANAQVTLDAARQKARVDAANAFQQEMQNNVLTMQAYDQNGMPMVDESTGRPVTLAEARERGQLKHQFKMIDKLTSDILNGQVQWENMTVDTLLKRYQLEVTNPAQLAVLRQTLSNLIAEGKKIDAETNVLGTQIGLNQSQTRLNNQNVVTQQRYASLLGQQTLTEKQRTSLAEIESAFGSSEKLVDVLVKLRPSNNAELAHWFADGVRGLVGRLIGSKRGDSKYILENLQDMNSDEIVSMINDAIHKGMSRK